MSVKWLHPIPSSLTAAAEPLCCSASDPCSSCWIIQISCKPAEKSKTERNTSLLDASYIIF